MNPETLQEFSSLLIGLILTLFIYSYILGDNPLYRLAVHLLVGVSAAYATVIAVREIIWPVLQALADNPGDPTNLVWIVPLVFAFLLLAKLVPATAGLGNSTMALLFAVGAAVSLMGAIVGTIIPLIIADYGQATANLSDNGLLSGLLSIIIALLTICTLGYFHFTGRVTAEGEVVLPRPQRYIALIGQIVITITLAALFSSVLSTSLALLTERVDFFFTGFADFVRLLIS